MDLLIRQAKESDFESVIKLLSENLLPTADLKDSNVHMFVGLKNGGIIASIGLEKFNSLGLLRSFSVDSCYKKQGVGDKLVTYLLEFCSLEKIDELYLLTTTADKYFKKYGFCSVERENVPEAIRQTREFKGICPVSAVVMVKKIV